MVSDVVVVPCGPSAVDAWALAATLDIIEEARTLRPELVPVVLITRKVTRTSLGANAREVLASSGLRVLDAELGHRVTYQEAPAAGLGVTTYTPLSPAADEIRALVNELESVAGTEASHVVL